MSTMLLEAEKNALIRQILDVDDIAILKKIRSMLNHEEEQVRAVAEEATPYRTKTEILESLDEACKELKLNLEGKLDFKPAEDLLDELSYNVFSSFCERIEKIEQTLQISEVGLCQFIGISESES